MDFALGGFAMKKILIVILESTILTLFFTFMSQASMLSHSPMSCRSTLSNVQRCAKITSVANAARMKSVGSSNSLRN
jgi:hypothetical protein